MKQQLHRQYRITRYVLRKETAFNFRDHFWSFLGAFLGIGIISWLQNGILTETENIFLIGSFGASAVLVYGAIKSPFSQPRNVIGGHFLSALFGVTIYKLLPEQVWIAAPLAVAGAIFLMQLTKTVHPPGGATALIAVIGTPKVKALGYWYALSPVLTGAMILITIALIINNIPSKRHYPASGTFLKSVNHLRGKKKNR